MHVKTSGTMHQPCGCGAEINMSIIVIGRQDHLLSGKGVIERNDSLYQIQNFKGIYFAFLPGLPRFSFTRYLTIFVMSSNGSGSFKGNCTDPFAPS